MKNWVKLNKPTVFSFRQFKTIFHCSSKSIFKHLLNGDEFVFFKEVHLNVLSSISEEKSFLMIFCFLLLHYCSFHVHISF